MLKKIMLVAAVGAGVLAVSAGDPFKVMVPMGADEDGAMAYIVNFDTNDKVDSVLVADGVAAFAGTMDEPYVARILVDGQRYAQFILEPGSIAFDAKTRRAFGSPLNDAFNEIVDSAMTIANELRNVAETDTAAGNALYERYDKLMADRMEANIDNPIGYMLFMQTAYDMQPAELEAYIAAHPSLASYQRVSKLVEMNRRKASTGEGAHYADFEVNGERLSDYVGKDGKYLLVDFWASWCGPCRRQLPVLKELQAKYADKLNVLGVAVWDEPDDTRRAIKDHGLTWPCIINAGSVPTDIYGISGIPCIMLIAPDGTIISRDKQDDDLRAAVAAALGK